MVEKFLLSFYCTSDQSFFTSEENFSVYHLSFFTSEENFSVYLIIICMYVTSRHDSTYPFPSLADSEMKYDKKYK